MSVGLNRCIWVCLCSVVFLFACGEEATETAKKCAESDLIAQCPPGTQPDLSAMAQGECGGEGSADLVMQAGSVTGSCAGSGSCRVLCRFDNPCECGVESISTEVLVCKECGGCGNGECEQGEDAESCPRDCGGGCVPGAERCNGAHRQVCSQLGEWEKVDCMDGTYCVEQDGDTECLSTCEEAAWYPDNDGDGFGQLEGGMLACEQPEGYVDNPDDCDDTDDSVHPGAAEVCDDRVDNNCNDQMDCQDASCMNDERCGEYDCNDGIDNDGNGAIDCSDIACAQQAICSEDCVDFCSTFGANCQSPNFDENQCRRECSELSPLTDQSRYFASASFECHSLYLPRTADNPEVFCSRARLGNQNEYCRRGGAYDCHTYCAMTDLFCPSTFSGDFATCHTNCRAFSGEGQAGDADIAMSAISCRISNVHNVGAVDGVECGDVRPSNSECPGLETVTVTGDSFYDGRERLDSLSFVRGSALIFATSQQQGRSAIRIFEGEMGSSRVFQEEILPENDLRTVYRFDEPGVYRAVVLLVTERGGLLVEQEPVLRIEITP